MISGLGGDAQHQVAHLFGPGPEQQVDQGTATEWLEIQVGAWVASIGQSDAKAPFVFTIQGEIQAHGLGGITEAEIQSEKGFLRAIPQGLAETQVRQAGGAKPQMVIGKLTAIHLAIEGEQACDGLLQVGAGRVDQLEPRPIEIKIETDHTRHRAGLAQIVHLDLHPKGATHRQARQILGADQYTGIQPAQGGRDRDAIGAVVFLTTIKQAQPAGVLHGGELAVLTKAQCLHRVGKGG